jgi:hypothetical protein
MSKTKLALDVVADLRSLANSIETFVLDQQTEIKNQPAAKEISAGQYERCGWFCSR